MYLTTGIPVEVATREANRALRYNVALLTPFLVLTYALALLIGKRAIVDRVRLLENASRNLAAGNLQTRVSDLVGGGELGRLGETFDAMAEQLARREAERVEAAEELGRLVSILESTTDVVSMVSTEGKLFYFNRAGRVLTGIEAQPTSEVPLSRVYPEWAADRVTNEGIPTAIREGVWKGETALLNGHGGEVPVSQVILSHRDAQGNLSHLSTIMRDISERKAAEAENDLLTRQLIQAQKMESIGQLAGGVAHDFNNLLTPIIGYSELLQADLTGDETALARVGNVLNAAQRAKDLVRQLLSFSRKQVMEMEVIDLNRVIAAFYSILRHTIRESIAIRLALAEEGHGIRADRNQIEQVIMNLAVNAQDAIGERGVITIETAFVLFDDAYARQHPEVSPGRYLMLAVTDDGCGMDQETRQRIFEPFFTTKGIGKGTGLGLATVYGIIQQHGGNIWVYSEPGQGATFKCYFPLVDEIPAGERPATQAGVSLAGDRRTILLVEDNEMIRTLVDDLLTREGFEVLVAEDPKEALRISRNRRLDLLITDVVMPYMTGPELHIRLLETYPGLKALYMSGYTNNLMTQQGTLGEGVRYLQKPFAIAEFLRITEALLKPASD
jgi:PAS domain S-box-containing protein